MIRMLLRKMFKDTHEKYLNKVRKKFKKAACVNKVVENTAGDEKSGKHPLVYLTIKDGSAECYYCGKMFVTKDTHEKYLNKVRKKFKKAAKNV